MHLLLPPGYYLGQHAKVRLPSNSDTHSERPEDCVKKKKKGRPLSWSLVSHMLSPTQVLLFFYSKLLPYGLGSPLSRRRRSADRCECHDKADKTCSGFCHKRWARFPSFIYLTSKQDLPIMSPGWTPDSIEVDSGSPSSISHVRQAGTVCWCGGRVREEAKWFSLW